MAVDLLSVQASIAMAVAFAGTLAFVQFVYAPWVYSEASYRLRRLAWEFKGRSGFKGRLPTSPQEYAEALEKADPDRKTVLVYCMGLDLAEKDIQALSLWKVLAILGPAMLHSRRMRSAPAAFTSPAFEETQNPDLLRLRNDVIKKALLILAFRMVACSLLASVVVLIVTLFTLARGGLSGVRVLADRAAHLLLGVWSPENAARDHIPTW